MRLLRKTLRPVPQAVRIPAVLDTGSPITCIEAQAFSSLGLPLVGSIEIFTTSTGPIPLTRDQYDIGLTLLHPSGNPALHKILGQVVITDVPLGHTGIPALIGCDLLDQWVFTYDAPAKTFTVVY